MTLMTWGPILEVGFGDIDVQHRKLVDLVNELDDAMRAGRGQDVADAVLDDLVNYTIHHFAFEEQLMDEYQISSAAGHKAEHEQLVVEVSAFRARIQSGSAPLSDLMALLRSWLTDHILKTDKALAKELLAKGAKSRA
jgi:hemerythrin-like metal-binding protein